MQNLEAELANMNDQIDSLSRENGLANISAGNSIFVLGLSKHTIGAQERKFPQGQACQDQVYLLREEFGEIRGAWAKIQG